MGSQGTVDVTLDVSSGHVIVLKQLTCSPGLSVLLPATLCHAVILSLPEYAKETSDSRITRTLRKPFKLDPVIGSFAEAFRVKDCDLPSFQIKYTTPTPPIFRLCFCSFVEIDGIDLMHAIIHVYSCAMKFRWWFSFITLSLASHTCFYGFIIILIFVM